MIRNLMYIEYNDYKVITNCKQDIKLFDEHSLIFNYITPYKVNEWNRESFNRMSLADISKTFTPII